MRAKPPRGRSPIGRAFGIALMIMAFVGCEQPIYRSVAEIEFPAAKVSSGATSGPSGSEPVSAGDPAASGIRWNMDRSGYRVSKPPPLTYAQNIDRPLPLPRSLQQKVIPWDRSLLTDEMNRLLDMELDSSEYMPRTMATLTEDQHGGENAFDVSRDGTRVVVLQNGTLTMYDAVGGDGSDNSRWVNTSPAASHHRSSDSRPPTTT